MISKVKIKIYDKKEEERKNTDILRLLVAVCSRPVVAFWKPVWSPEESKITSSKKLSYIKVSAFYIKYKKMKKWKNTNITQDVLTTKISKMLIKKHLKYIYICFFFLTK